MDFLQIITFEAGLNSSFHIPHFFSFYLCGKAKVQIPCRNNRNAAFSFIFFYHILLCLSSSLFSPTFLSQPLPLPPSPSPFPFPFPHSVKYNNKIKNIFSIGNQHCCLKAKPRGKDNKEENTRARLNKLQTNKPSVFIFYLSPAFRVFSFSPSLSHSHHVYISTGALSLAP